MKIKNYKFIIVFFLFIACWGAVYFDALVAMEIIWRKSDTFAHGYFIFPISAWLIWRDKQTLLVNVTTVSTKAAITLFISLLIWLFAFAADINALGQLSAVVSLISICWLFIGDKLAWHYKFPLGFLLFLVPVGQSLIPWLQDVTAWFTVSFLKLNGIPVFRDGLYIQIPSGLFEVAVACSGIRYLIASIAVGTLFAYLTYQKPKKQFFFIIFSAVLPIIANGIRAYLIVAIAHYSDLKYATGADHLVYGWVFFGFVIMLMFYIGGKFADPEPNLAQGVNFNNQASSKNTIIYSSLVSILFTWLLISNTSITSKPEQVTASLKGENLAMSSWGITYLDGLSRSHIQVSKNVEMMRAVYGQKQTKGELISWNNNPFSRNDWTVIEKEEISLNGHRANFVHIRNARGENRFITYWFVVDEEIIISEFKVKLTQAYKTFIAPNSSAEIIAISHINSSKQQVLESVNGMIVKLPSLFKDE